MEQLKIEWTVINSKLVKYMTSLVNKRIEKAYIKLPSKTLSDKYNNVGNIKSDMMSLTEEELIFNKIQNEEVIEYDKISNVLRDLKECHDKINIYGKKKIEELNNKYNNKDTHNGDDDNNNNNNNNINNKLTYKYNIRQLEEILSNYNQEMKVKERIVDDINCQAKREILLAYTATILMEPYLTQNTTSLY